MEHIEYTINDNDRYKPQSLNNDGKKLNKKDPAQADDIASQLQAKFDPGAILDEGKSWPFYCLVAWSLDQSTIDRLVATAKEKGYGNGAKLFTYLANKEIKKRLRS